MSAPRWRRRYYAKLPPNIQDSYVLLIDPMLATGGSAVAALDMLTKAGARHLRLVCIVAAPEGVAAVEKAYPSVPIFSPVVDRELNAHKFIVPGLGDFGRRCSRVRGPRQGRPGAGVLRALQLRTIPVGPAAPLRARQGPAPVWWIVKVGGGWCRRTLITIHDPLFTESAAPLNTELTDIIDPVIRGFARLERGVYPVLELESGPVRFLRWPETGRRGAEFSEEFFALDLDPAKVLAAVRAARPGPDHLIAEIAARTEPATDAYLAAGYEFGSAEPLLVADLTDDNSLARAGATEAERVTSMAEVEQILAAQASVGYPARLFSQALLDDPGVGIRAIFVDGAFAAIGKLAMVETGGYVTDVQTMPEHRRQGLAETIMRQLHADARGAGLTRAVLTSTAMARPLYERLGYRQLATVTIYATPESRA